MSRGISSTLRNRFDDDSFYLNTLLRIRRSGVTYFLTDWRENLFYGGNLYTSSPFLLEISGASESQELRINDMNISLSGVDQTFIASFLNNPNTTADTVTIFRSVINPDVNAVLGAFVMFEGRIAQFGIDEDDEDSQVNIQVASHWADFEKIINRKTNQNSQQIYFPNDLGFQYASKVVKDLRWGRKA